MADNKFTKLVPPNASVEEFEIPSFRGPARSYQKIRSTFSADAVQGTGGRFVL